jgi:hypothetical protein
MTGDEIVDVYHGTCFEPGGMEGTILFSVSKAKVIPTFDVKA